MKSLSIIIPVFNEEKTIVKMLDNLKKIRFPCQIEIIFVDDGSTDNSAELIKANIRKNSTSKKKYILIQKENGGKGSAIRRGFKKASSEAVIIQDADLEYSPEEIITLIEELEKGEADVIHGSRMLRHNPTSSRLYYFGNWFLSLSTSFLYGSRITDMETCYKLIPLKIIRELNLVSDKFDIEPEITAKILRKGYSIKEVPISYSPRTKKEGKKIGVRDGFQALWQLVKWRFKDI